MTAEYCKPLYANLSSNELSPFRVLPAITNYFGGGS
jgi:hypothetical protein